MIKKKIFYKNFLLMVLMFFTLIFPFSIYDIKLDNGYNINLTISHLISLIYIIQKIPLLKKLYTDKENSFFIFNTLTLILFTILNYYFTHREFIYFGFLKIIPILAFCTIFFDLSSQSEFDLKRMMKYLIILLFLSLFVSIILSLYNINGIFFSRQNVIEFKKNDYFFASGQLWIYSNKSQFAMTCMFSMIITVIYPFKNKFFKYILSFLILINLYYSNSYTFLFLYLLFVIWYNFMLNKKIDFKFFLGIKTLLVPFFIYFFIELINYISKQRNIYTLGNRTLIWEKYFNIIKEYPFGIGLSFRRYIHISHLFVVDEAHNIFIQEFVENGYIGGTLLVIFFYQIAKKIYISNKVSFVGFLFILLGGSVDLILYGNSINSFYYILAFLFSFNYKKTYLLKNKIKVI